MEGKLMKKLEEKEDLITRILAILFIWLIGVAFGYFWCWKALN